MKKVILSILTSFFLILSFGQGRGQDEDFTNRVRLVGADTLRQMEIDSVIVRWALNPIFFHNNAHLFCDTAYFIDNEYIDAIGNVKIIQEGTILYSDKIHYIIPEDLAQVRGRIVKLVDKDSNILMTNFLDYNTKDSIATFFNGGSMRDKDGNVIEGERGSYDTKIKVFTFHNNVQMFSDTLFFISDYMRYEAEVDVAYFGANTHGWQDKNYLSANGGRYERANEFINFIKDVYVESEDQELFCDTLNYYKNLGDIVLFDNVQVTDTTQNMIALGDKLEYFEDSKEVLITEYPALAMYEVKNTISEDSLSTITTRDTLFAAADTLYLFSKKMFEIDSAFVAEAKKRRELAFVDPIAEFRKKKETSTASSEEKSSIENAVIPESQENIATDSLSVSNDTTDVAPPIVKGATDTTKIDFLLAYHNVRIYREDMQIICDSLIYSGLDSIARLFKDPVIWNNTKNQLTADSMQMIIENDRFTRGNLISNAMIITDEGEDKFYNQIKGAEMTGFFNEDNEVYRFDALGGASAVIYITENEGKKVSSMNKAEGKMLTVALENQEVATVTWFETIKNDLTPVKQVKSDDMYLKGFKWSPEKRPESRYVVTDRKIRPSGRSTAPKDLFPAFEETKTYFPGYIENIFGEISYRDSVNRVREEERRLRELAEQDSLAAVAAAADTLDVVEEIIDSALVDLPLEEIKEQTPEEKYEALRSEYEELRNKNRSEMTRQEKREWRKEKKRVKKEMKIAKKELKIDS